MCQAKSNLALLLRVAEKISLGFLPPAPQHECVEIEDLHKRPLCDVGYKKTMDRARRYHHP